MHINLILEEDKMKNKWLLIIAVILTSMILVSCKGSSLTFSKTDEMVKQVEAIAENKGYQVNTDSVIKVPDQYKMDDYNFKYYTTKIRDDYYWYWIFVNNTDNPDFGIEVSGDIDKQPHELDFDLIADIASYLSDSDISNKDLKEYCDLVLKNNNTDITSPYESYSITIDTDDSVSRYTLKFNGLL